MEKGVRQVKCGPPLVGVAVTRSKPGGWDVRRREDWSIRLQHVSLLSHWGRSPVPPHYADHSSYTARAPSPPGATPKQHLKTK